MLVKTKIQSYLLSVVYFFNFFGYYLLLLILANLGTLGLSQLVTIPLRFVIILSLLLLFLISPRFFNTKLNLAFLFFCFLYLCRIIADYLYGYDFYIGTFQQTFYFVSFAVIPFLIMSSFSLNDFHISRIRTSLLFSAFIFSIVALVFYGNFLGQVTRLSSTWVDAEIISPLSLAYCGVLAIGIAWSSLVNQANTRTGKLFLTAIIIISLAPFFLGASRGAFLALLVPVFIEFFAKKGKNKFRMLGFLIVSGTLVALVVAYLGGGVLDRMMNLNLASQSGEPDLRLQIWGKALSQFIDSPILGGKFAIDNFNGHSHSIVIEVLQTTGIIGFVPFCILVYKAVRVALLIFRRFPEYSWMSILFFQSFIQHLFSSALFMASWFWLSMGLLFSMDYFLKRNSRNFASNLQHPILQSS